MTRGAARLARVAGIATALAWLAPAALAQTPLPHSEALACLTPAADQRGVPEYDPELVKRGDGGRVKVELVFAEPDAPPAVRFLGPYKFEGLTRAVERHVRRFRVPCQVAGAEPARLLFEFVFTPDDGQPVHGLPPIDAAEQQREEMARCLTRIEPGERPEYPDLAQVEEIQGSVLVRLTFVKPDRAPEFDVLFAPRLSRSLQLAVRQFVQGLRLPCMGEQPVKLVIDYRFSIDGAKRVVVPPTPLARLVRSALSYPKPAFFDLTTMGCPFDLRMALFQPYSSNRVEQVGEPQASREPLMRWLAEMKIQIVAEQRDLLIGRPFTVTVPCGRVEL
jgi:hypothetical protein